MNYLFTAIGKAKNHLHCCLTSQSLVLFCYSVCATCCSTHLNTAIQFLPDFHQPFQTDTGLHSWFCPSFPLHWLALLNRWHPWQNPKWKSIWVRLRDLDGQEIDQNLPTIFLENACLGHRSASRRVTEKEEENFERWGQHCSWLCCCT